MNAVDGTVLILLALADITFLAYLRRRRARALRMQRMWRSLALAIRRESSGPLAGIRGRWARPVSGYRTV